ncbi:MAG TPA: hypothetical protein PKA33_18260 [Amaricoccus sp.]|nr:hypothetical protein [Amaricoccus sp.]HMQ94828.1 hypothetical protein [Amaricoccus sp.]HMR54285.1 hypothetical protein [Amaricoccus sp.]HMU01292.1 hypothetical protein [Amaricoccus sp.]
MAETLTETAWFGGHDCAVEKTLAVAADSSPGTALVDYSSQA